jgi:citrate lyase subunit beta/citryl-CoA lyase
MASVGSTTTTEDEEGGHGVSGSAGEATRRAASAEVAERRATRESTRVGAADARSWRLVSALHTDQFTRAQLGSADQIIFDLEDAIDESLKNRARQNVLEWLREGGRGWVRLNSRPTRHWRDDVDRFVGAQGLAGVVLAKTEAPSHVTDTFHELGGHTPVIPLIESALGIESAVEIARADGAFRLAFGSGDYRRDTGAENTALAMAYPRTRLVLASRISGLPGPIDGPTIGSTHALLREQAADAVSLGMTGKLCLDGEQPAIINESMSPSPADVAWALDFLADFESRGSVIRDGSDKPRLARASTISRRAELFHIQPAGR